MGFGEEFNMQLWNEHGGIPLGRGLRICTDTYLRIDNINLSTSTVDIIIANLEKLQVIDGSCMFIEENDLKRLLTALASPKCNLRKLDLAFYGNTVFNEEHKELLGDLFKKNKGLRHFKMGAPGLCAAQLGDGGLTKLVEGLCENTTLETLSIRDQKDLTDESAKSIVKLLKNNRTIKDFSFYTFISTDNPRPILQNYFVELVRHFENEPLSRSVSFQRFNNYADANSLELAKYALRQGVSKTHTIINGLNDTWKTLEHTKRELGRASSLINGDSARRR